MTTASSCNAWHPEGIGTQLPAGANVPLQASAQVGRGQLIVLDVSGNGIIGDGASPGLLVGGVGEAKLSDTNGTAGVAKAPAWWGFSAMTFSTGAGDTFTAADLGGVPAFDAGGNTIGRKSNVNGSNNRSIVGMVYGLNDDGSARFWGGPVAQAVARSMLLLNAFPLASFGVADAAASTAIAERSIRRPKIKGTVTDVTFTGAALVIGDTDYVTVSIAKRDGAGGSAVVLATYDSRAAGNGAVTAFVPKALTLSVVAGALYLLETDVVTITTVKGGSGQVLTGEFLINGKAI